MTGYYFTNADTCNPLPGLWIAVWQCDAIGYYSGQINIDPSIAYEGPDHAPVTDNSTFLRGVQQTDENGKVQFATVLPGWYAKRTRHIHFKIICDDMSVFTGQLYFMEQLSDWLYGVFPYYVQKRVLNSGDYLFVKYGGNQSTISDIKPLNDQRLSDGFVGQIRIGLNLKPSQHKSGKTFWPFWYP